MQALFVHGMGRTHFSGLPMLWRMRKHGISTSSFFYSVTFEDFPSIVNRLRQRVVNVANRDEYVLIGHSLGGVIIRSVLASLPEGTRMPNRVFIMGSPVRPSRIAKYLGRNWLYWLVTRDCGQMLGSEERMQCIPPCGVPTTSFVGTSGIHGRLSPFGDEINDGVVAESEVSATWITEEIKVPVVHSWMPSSKQITQLIIERIENARDERVAWSGRC